MAVMLSGCWTASASLMPVAERDIPAFQTNAAGAIVYEANSGDRRTLTLGAERVFSSVMNNGTTDFARGTVMFDQIAPGVYLAEESGSEGISYGLVMFDSAGDVRVHNLECGSIPPNVRAELMIRVDENASRCRFGTYNQVLAALRAGGDNYATRFPADKANSRYSPLRN